MNDPDELFPESTIAGWLDAEGIAPGEPLTFERITDGRSHVMFRVARGDQRFVLRRPTRVAIEKADDGIRREFRVLTALAGTDVPHPAALALCDDTDLTGCAFEVDVVGAWLEQHLPTEWSPTITCSA